MRKILIAGILAFALIASAGLASALTINGGGSGFYYQQTDLTDNGDTLHDALTINSGLWNLDMNIGTGSFNIDRTVSFTDPMHSSTANQGWFGGAIFDTTFDDGSENINVYSELNIVKTYKNMHGPGSMSQTYTAGSSVDSYIQALTGSADSNFIVGMSGSVTAGDFLYYYDHTGTNGLKDRSVLSASDPSLDFGIYGSGGSGSMSTVDVYATADFSVDVDGTIGYNRPSGSDGTVGYMAPNYDPLWSSTFTGTEVDFSGNLFDITYSGFVTGGNWNHVYPSFGFTVGYFS